MKRSIRSRAALRGWETRRSRARARSEAAKRGWVTRRKPTGQKETLGYVIRCGYSSSKQNSYAMEIEVNPHKRLSSNSLTTLMERLCGEGHFDSKVRNLGGPRDLQWATGQNSFEILSRKMMPRGTARLIYFSRESP